MDMASHVREEIFSAIRAFTCATVAEAEEATRAIVRIVDNASPHKQCDAEETGYPRADGDWHPGDEM